MLLAVELAASCPAAETAYSVGAVIVAADGTELARGYSRDAGPASHAEEGALGRVDRDDPRLRGATLYSTLEPCAERRSAPRTCADLILDAGIRRVVIAWREPALFVARPSGCEVLSRAGVSVTELPEFAVQVRAANAHLPIGGPPPATGSHAQ
jgi:diaminohydroxyphosphoribosylaminopyrimidine deaminase/5-amino-6-(5-phosphoribosylamino)uracil reductase